MVIQSGGSSGLVPPLLLTLTLLITQDLSDAFIRTEPSNPLDKTLLEKAIPEVGSGWSMAPIILPLDAPRKVSCHLYTHLPSFLLCVKGASMRYFFIGHGVRTCLFWFDGQVFRALRGRCRLSCKVSSRESYALSDCVVHKMNWS